MKLRYFKECMKVYFYIKRFILLKGYFYVKRFILRYYTKLKRLLTHKCTKCGGDKVDWRGAYVCEDCGFFIHPDTNKFRRALLIEKRKVFKAFY